MAGFVHFLRCVGKAVVKHGLRSLAGLVPLGDNLYDIASDALADYRHDNADARLRSEIEALAQATPDEAKRAAEAVVRQVAADQPPAVQQALTAYLSQVPAAVRQSLRRPADPTGTTVPATLALRRPEDLLPFLPQRLPRRSAKSGSFPRLLAGAAVAAVLLCVVIGVVALALSASGTPTSRRAESTEGSQSGGGSKELPEALRSLPGGQGAEIEIAAGMKMRFCWVPPGEAQLGSPKAERQEVLKLIKADKEPEWLAAEAEEVRGKFKAKGFWLAKYPVTQEQWQAVMGNNPSYFSPDGADKDYRERVKGIDTSRFPVENVCWDDPNDKEDSAQEFLRKVNASVKVPAAMGKGRFVLPYEDEWEYAARGGKGNKQAFYFGDRLNGDKANCDGTAPYGTDKPGDYKHRTTAVGEYEKLAPHPWGLCDMSGNVYQWCENKYKPVEDSRVIRGGSWGYLAADCRAAYRFGLAAGYRSSYVGFRPCFRLD